MVVVNVEAEGDDDLVGGVSCKKSQYFPLGQPLLVK